MTLNLILRQVVLVQESKVYRITKEGHQMESLIVDYSNPASHGHIHLQLQVHTIISVLFILGWMGL
jgi:hypothetical protein